MNFTEARNRENDGEAIYCARCGKITSTYPRKTTAVGVQMSTECMCASPKYIIHDPKKFKEEILQNNAELELENGV